MTITPQWLSDFETSLNVLISSQSERIVRNLIWDKVADQKESKARRELYFFLLESMKLTAENLGGNKRFDEMVAKSLEIENKEFGAGLVLTRNEIEDNQMKDPAGMPPLDYAAAWARKMAANAARFPQDALFDLLATGETATGYDGVAFFSASHPTFDAAGTTFQNLLTGGASGSFPGACPIDAGGAATLDIAATNFGKAVAFVEGLTGADGKTRNLKVKYAMAGVGLRKRLLELLDTKYLTTTGIENVISRYGIEPIIASEITAASTYYYLICEFEPGEGGPLIYQRRREFELRPFSYTDDAALSRARQLEWHFDGRNAMAFGHPWMIFKVKAS